VNSLARRLDRVLLVMLGGLLVQWFLADRMIVTAAESEMATRLSHDTDSLFATLDLRPDADPPFDASRAGTIYGREYSGHYFVIAIGKRRYASASFGPAPPFDPAITADEGLHYVDGPRGQPLLVLTTSFDVNGTHVGLAVGEDLTQMRGQLFEFRLLFLALSTVVLAGALLLQRRELRRALRPLDSIRQAVVEIHRGGRPLVATDAPVEIRPLVDEVNRLLAFVTRRLAQSRTAIGNLSHAIKTPLAVVFRLLEDPRMADVPELRSTLQAQADAIRTRIDRELTRARLAGDAPTQATFDARAELPALVALLRQIHAGKDLAVAWTAPAGALPLDREDMLELIGNLSDNACKWATSRVTIDVRDAPVPEIVVADDGPGCSPETLASLATRGVRADETVEGHGLGLAIARDIVEFAGGHLAFRRSPSLGGLEATARFDARAAPAL
jgi:signal transduction histidine kinase